MAENDVQLDLKKRARRRLVGAIVLALAAVIILPMVMDSEQRPGNQELSIRIPSQEEGAPLLSRPLTAAPAPERPRLPQPTPVPPAPIEAEQAPAPATPRTEVSAPPAHVSPPASVVSSSAASTPTPAAPSAASPVVAAPEAERARQILEGARSSVTSTTATTVRHFVQLGLYREEANARSAVAKAREAGIKAQVERHGEQFRVVVGPFSTRAAADETLGKVRKAGLSGFVASK